MAYHAGVGWFSDTLDLTVVHGIELEGISYRSEGLVVHPKESDKINKKMAYVNGKSFMKHNRVDLTIQSRWMTSLSKELNEQYSEMTKNKIANRYSWFMCRVIMKGTENRCKAEDTNDDSDKSDTNISNIIKERIDKYNVSDENKEHDWRNIKKKELNLIPIHNILTKLSNRNSVISMIRLVTGGLKLNRCTAGFELSKINDESKNDIDMKKGWYGIEEMEVDTRRCCKRCSEENRNVVETEEHVLFDCSYYEQERNHYVKLIKKELELGNNISAEEVWWTAWKYANENQFCLKLMRNEKYDSIAIANIIGNWILKLSNIRKKTVKETPKEVDKESQFISTKTINKKIDYKTVLPKWWSNDVSKGAQISEMHDDIYTNISSQVIEENDGNEMDNMLHQEPISKEVRTSDVNGLEYDTVTRKGVNIFKVKPNVSEEISKIAYPKNGVMQGRIMRRQQNKKTRVTVAPEKCSTENDDDTTRLIKDKYKVNSGKIDNKESMKHNVSERIGCNEDPLEGIPLDINKGLNTLNVVPNTIMEDDNDVITYNSKTINNYLEHKENIIGYEQIEHNIKPPDCIPSDAIKDLNINNFGLDKVFEDAEGNIIYDTNTAITYFERQENMKCGLHALNNAIGACVINESKLHGISLQIAQRYNIHISELYHNDGNYDISVIIKALLNEGYLAEIINTTNIVVQNHEVPSRFNKYMAYIIHEKDPDHWVAARRITHDKLVLMDSIRGMVIITDNCLNEFIVSTRHSVITIDINDDHRVIHQSNEFYPVTDPATIIDKRKYSNVHKSHLEHGLNETNDDYGNTLESVFNKGRILDFVEIYKKFVYYRSDEPNKKIIDTLNNSVGWKIVDEDIIKRASREYQDYYKAAAKHDLDNIRNMSDKVVNHRGRHNFVHMMCVTGVS